MYSNHQMSQLNVKSDLNGSHGNDHVTISYRDETPVKNRPVGPAKKRRTQGTYVRTHVHSDLYTCVCCIIVLIFSI